MARAGRGFPLGTQYLQQPTVQTTHRMQGSATFRLVADNTTQVPRKREIRAVSKSTPRVQVIRTGTRTGGWMRVLPVNNDHVISRAFTRLNDSTGTYEKGSAIGIVTGFFSLTENGGAIDASLSVALEERAGQPGEYFGTLKGDTLAALLGALVGQVIYERVEIQGGIHSDAAAYVVGKVRSLT